MNATFEVNVGGKCLNVEVKDGAEVPKGVPAAVSKRVKQVGYVPYNGNAQVVILVRDNSPATFGNLVIVWGNGSTYIVSFCLKNGSWKQTEYQRVTFGPIQIRRL